MLDLSTFTLAELKDAADEAARLGGGRLADEVAAERRRRGLVAVEDRAFAAAAGAR